MADPVREIGKDFLKKYKEECDEVLAILDKTPNIKKLSEEDRKKVDKVIRDQRMILDNFNV